MSLVEKREKWPIGGQSAGSCKEWSRNRPIRTRASMSLSSLSCWIWGFRRLQRGGWVVFISGSESGVGWDPFRLIYFFLQSPLFPLFPCLQALALTGGHSAEAAAQLYFSSGLDSQVSTYNLDFRF